MNLGTLFVENLIGTILKQYNFSENNFHELVIFYTKIIRARATCPSAKCVTNAFKHKLTSMSLYV